MADSVTLLCLLVFSMAGVHLVSSGLVRLATKDGAGRRRYGGPWVRMALGSMLLIGTATLALSPRPISDNPWPSDENGIDHHTF